MRSHPLSGGRRGRSSPGARVCVSARRPRGGHRHSYAFPWNAGSSVVRRMSTRRKEGFLISPHLSLGSISSSSLAKSRLSSCATRVTFSLATHPKPTAAGANASPPTARLRSRPARPGQFRVPTPLLKREQSSLPSFLCRPSLSTSLTCGARALSVPDPLRLRRLLLGTFRHCGGSYSYSGGAGSYFRFR